MNDELEVLKLVVQRLEAAGMQYMVSGSMAMNFYAEPRMTRDIDIVVELEVADADRLVQMFSDFYCDVNTIRDAIAHRTLFNMIHHRSVVKVDFIVRKDEKYRRTELARRRSVVWQGVTLWVVTPEDLVLSKLWWARPSHSALQLGDVRNLIDSVQSLDWEYIERWATELGVTDLLQEVRHG
jgi:hypothetical protein